MPFSIIRNDITRVKADAIVNSANPLPVIGGGSEYAIYQAAGAEKLLQERKKIGPLKPGEAAASQAYGLGAKWLIHTVGPDWIDGQHGEAATLASCYEHSLALADKLKCQSIAFPLISTGTYGFPKDLALQVAVNSFSRFLMEHDMEVVLVVYDRTSFVLSGKLMHDITAEISDTDINELILSTRNSLAEGLSFGSIPVERKRNEQGNHWHNQFNNGGIGADNGVTTDLQSLLEQPQDTFQQRLFKLIDQSGMDDVTVYKRANVDRKVFSKIRSNVHYHPAKKTAVAFAIALHLDLDETEDLLARAGFALSPSDTFDKIIKYFIVHQDYDVLNINTVLFDCDQPQLG